MGMERIPKWGGNWGLNNDKHLKISDLNMGQKKETLSNTLGGLAYTLYY